MEIVEKIYCPIIFSVILIRTRQDSIGKPLRDLTEYDNAKMNQTDFFYSIYYQLLIFIIP